MDEKVTTLKGVGKKIELLLAKLGIETVGDLVKHYPRRYDDFSKVMKVDELVPGPVTLEVGISSVTGRYVRRGLHITEAVLTDETGSVKAVWFNQPYRAKQLSTEEQYFCSGKYEFTSRSYSIMNPSLEKVSDMPVNAARVIPIYSETKGLKSHQLRKLMKQINFDSLGEFEELPFETELSRKDSLHLLHFPGSSADVDKANAYFEFEELFTMVLAATLIKADNKALNAPPIIFNEDKVVEMVKSLPFKLTNAQRKVAWSAFNDMKADSPMNRLVEGDVGSGKTVVAAMLAYNAILQGFQAAFMAPTEVLASQHFSSLKSILPDNVSISLYTGSMKTAEKNQAKEALASGETDLIVGTHSLIQKGVEFKNLGFVVIDEQHRFGVKQRAALSAHSVETPHILSMTATPIPRTLALTVFGDLDISIIDEMPAGRKPIITKLIAPNSRKAVHARIKQQLDEGRQAFIIYPLIEDSEKLELKSAQVEYDLLSRTTFKDYKVGLLHGRMKGEEKNEVMEKFAAGETDLLISTTVVEVGVDVPNATVMVVEGAERFGLAQLHQLRGRVGRGEHQAYCLLIPTTSQTGRMRLSALETMTDGFSLAEYDLELRGPGAIYGTSQHGDLDISFAKLNDPRKIARAQEIAADLVNNPDELLKYPSLMNKISNYRAITSLN